VREGEVILTPANGERRFGRNLLIRVTIAVVFVPLFLMVSYVGGIPFFLYVEVLIFLGIREYICMIESSGHTIHRKASMTFALGFGALFFLFPGNAENLAMVFIFTIVLFFLIQWLFSGREDSTLEAVGFSIVGVLYVGFFFSHQILLREVNSHSGESDILGWYYLLFPYLIVWTSDTAAYFIGILIGRHRLAPKISPGKSIEGAVAGLIFSVAVAVTYQSFISEYLSLKDALILGFIVAIVCQIGDMIESRIKRETGVKDSSSFIPGHGGILDRYDGLLVAVPVVYYYLLGFSPLSSM
jgi:phosphatidate cytidylyltransferase